MSSQGLLRTTSLRYSYSDGPSFEFPDLTLPQGGQMLIIGPSGCGKTTLLHLLAGLRALQHGDVLMGNEKWSSIRNMDTFRGRHIGIVFQEAHFVKSISVRKNLELASWCAGKPTSAPSVEHFAEMLNFSHRLQSTPDKLSQGEKQRVSIARALINKPDLLLADEPTSALDDENCNRVVKLLETAAADTGASLVIVTHDVRLKSLMPNQYAL